MNLTSPLINDFDFFFPLSLEDFKNSFYREIFFFIFFCMVLLFIRFIFYPPLLYKSQDLVMYFFLYGYFVFNVYIY